MSLSQRSGMKVWLNSRSIRGCAFIAFAAQCNVRLSFSVNRDVSTHHPSPIRKQPLRYVALFCRNAQILFMPTTGLYIHSLRSNLGVKPNSLLLFMTTALFVYKNV